MPVQPEEGTAIDAEAEQGTRVGASEDHALWPLTVPSS